jgi:hypothetical protein
LRAKRPTERFIAGTELAVGRYATPEELFARLTAAAQSPE